MKLEEGIIEIKKDFIYEKDMRSKVSKINVMSSQSKKIDKMLTELKIGEKKHVCFEHARSEERLAAMHCEKMKKCKSTV